MSMQMLVRVRLQGKAARQSHDIGIKSINRDPVRGAQVKFEHDGRLIRARVMTINRQGDDSVTAVEGPASQIDPVRATTTLARRRPA